MGVNNYRILYIQPGPDLGGSKLSLYHIVKCALKNQVSYLALSSPPSLDYEEMINNFAEKVYYLDLPTWQRFPRRTIFEKFREPFGNVRRIVKLLPAVKKLVNIIKNEKIDLIHTNNSICPAGAFAAKLTKKPHIWHIRESFGTHRQYRPILGDKITFWLMRTLSNEIICNSQYTAEPLRDHQIKHMIVQNGIDTTVFQKFQGNGLKLREQLGIKPGEISIAMVGNLTTELKRHDAFLRIASILSSEFTNLKFVIFGGSNNLDQTEYTRNLQQTTINLGIVDRIIWVDHIKDTAAIMSSIDILVHLAMTEGSGRVIMEGMASGKPVLAMNSGGVKELIHDGKTGFLFNPEDLEGILNTLRRLITDPEIRNEIGKHAQRFALQEYSDQASYEKISWVYQSLIQKEDKK